LLATDEDDGSPGPKASSPKARRPKAPRPSRRARTSVVDADANWRRWRESRERSALAALALAPVRLVSFVCRGCRPREVFVERVEKMECGQDDSLELPVGAKIIDAWYGDPGNRDCGTVVTETVRNLHRHSAFAARISTGRVSIMASDANFGSFATAALVNTKVLRVKFLSDAGSKCATRGCIYRRAPGKQYCSSACRLTCL